MAESHTEKAIEKQLVYAGRIFDIEKYRVELYDGTQTGRDVVRHNGGACIVALDEDDNILLVKQYRFPIACEQLEIPAGKIEKGESPEQTAFREIEEETGHKTDKVTLLTSLYPTPGYSSEIIYVYAAGSLTVTSQSLDADERIDVVKIPFSRAVEMVESGQIQDAKTQIGILMYSRLKKNEGGSGCQLPIT